MGLFSGPGNHGIGRGERVRIESVDIRAIDGIVVSVTPGTVSEYPVLLRLPGGFVAHLTDAEASDMGKAFAKAVDLVRNGGRL